MRVRTLEEEHAEDGCTDAHFKFTSKVSSRGYGTYGRVNVAVTSWEWESRPGQSESLVVSPATRTESSQWTKPDHVSCTSEYDWFIYSIGS